MVAVEINLQETLEQIGIAICEICGLSVPNVTEFGKVVIMEFRDTIHDSANQSADSSRWVVTYEILEKFLKERSVRIGMTGIALITYFLKW